MIHFTIVEPEINNVFIVVDINIYGNARTLEDDLKKKEIVQTLNFIFT